MNERTERQLMRLLSGELPEADARHLRGRLEQEPDLQLAFSALQRRWEALELPPQQPAPRSFAERVVHRAVRGAATSAVGVGRASTLWARAAAAAALVGGIVLGALLASPSETEEWVAWAAAEPTQAEVYWETLGVASDDLQREDLR